MAERRLLTDKQFECLRAVWLGSQGAGSDSRTLDALHLRGLVTVREHEGKLLWDVSERGSWFALRIMNPDPQLVSGQEASDG